MSVDKVFSHDDQELRVYLNADKLCFLTTYTKGEEAYAQYILLDSDDLTELITELKFIKKEMDNE